MSTNRKRNLKDLNQRLGPMTLGEFLQSWRLADEMTQREFAQILGMSPANLCDIEKGRKGVSVEKAAEIAEAIGYSPAILVCLALAEQLRAAGLEYEVEVKPSRKKAAG